MFLILVELLAQYSVKIKFFAGYVKLSDSNISLVTYRLYEDCKSSLQDMYKLQQALFALREWSAEWKLVV